MRIKRFIFEYKDRDEDDILSIPDGWEPISIDMTDCRVWIWAKEVEFEASGREIK